MRQKKKSELLTEVELERVTHPGHLEGRLLATIRALEESVQRLRGEWASASERSRRNLDEAKRLKARIVDLEAEAKGTRYALADAQADLRAAAESAPVAPKG